MANQVHCTLQVATRLLNRDVPIGFGVIEIDNGWTGYVYFTEGLSRLTLPLGCPQEALAALGKDVHRGVGTASDVEALTTFLEDYFAGIPVESNAFTLDLKGHTNFRRKVWECVRKIPRGEVRTYAGVAGEVGEPGAARAVGAAMAANPVCVLIPCHRVIASDGGLGGFGGGLSMKRRMLEMEGALPRL